MKVSRLISLLKELESKNRDMDVFISGAIPLEFQDLTQITKMQYSGETPFIVLGIRSEKNE